MRTDIHPGIFVSRQDSYLQMFDDEAQNMLRAARLLREVMNKDRQENLGSAVEEVRESVEKGDEIAHRIYARMNRSFITPFERKDIHLLTSEIDVALKSISGIIRRKYIYRQYDDLDAYREMADLIYEAALEVAACIRSLSDPGGNKKKIQRSCSRIKSIEHLADEKYSAALALLFDRVTDMKILMSNNKLLEMLESCVDEMEDISDTIRSILVKVV